MLSHVYGLVAVRDFITPERLDAGMRKCLELGDKNVTALLFKAMSDFVDANMQNTPIESAFPIIETYARGIALTA